MWQLPVSHDKHIASEVEPIEEARCTEGSAIELHMRTTFQGKVRNVDILVYCRGVRLLAVPANRDEAGIVVHAVLEEAVIAVKNSVALIAYDKLSFSVDAKERGSPLRELRDGTITGCGVLGINGS